MSLSDDVQTLLTEQCEAHRMPGASAAYLYDGTVHYACHGVTALDNPVPVNEDTLFGIGSTSKTLTATAMLALVEQGKASLDDLVIKHLPDLNVLDEQARDSVTLWHLLDHTAGWVGDGSTSSGWGDNALDVAVPVLLAAAPQHAQPGELLSYNNTAFTVAGLVVSKLHGTTFEQAVQSLVLDPLGMANTFYLVWEIANRRHASGHIADADGAIATGLWPTDRWLGPSGGAFSTARDMMTYSRFHLTGETAGKAPISEESRLLMQQQRSSSRSGVEGIGVSWLLSSRDGLRLVEHGGNLSNIMVSTLSLAPSIPLAVTCMGNSAAGNAVGTALRDLLLDSVTDLPKQVPAPLATQPDLDEYVGRYAAGQWDVEVVEKAGVLDFGMRLTSTSSNEVTEELRNLFEATRTEAVFVDTDLVMDAQKPGAPVGDFIRDNGGHVQFFRTGLRLCAKYGIAAAQPVGAGR